MAKAKVTDKGNVQVTMTQSQWITLNGILGYVRLGFKPGMTADISDLVTDLSEFNSEYSFDEEIADAYDSVGYSIDKDDGFVIELKD